ncbi:hypothetical protein [Cellulomonas sp. ATA003]|uniref:hypothetical protein n=1 Tax=Cellulomonas sp. ATA003 TaxID=3073064 RepID=UPI00287331D4|nr:hypothetical protein [Cellulomonas sp. ATA003]WNB87000.1 hypothetical protein REH70_07615 [Cellulomonas sp. ATA003]
MSTEVARRRATDADAADPRGAAPPRRSAWTVLTGALGAMMGVAPHVLHHVGPLVGTALVAGAGGTALFGLLGLVASVPMLLRLRRRFGSWRAPALALVVFAAMFLVSTLVIGPRISGVDNPVNPEITDVEHGEHHPA